jgi:hypothetical protein
MLSWLATLPALGQGGGLRFLTFRVRVNPNGEIDRSGTGYYALLLNAFAEPIEVTDLDTFTDFIRFDGQNFDWYHRIGGQPGPSFNFLYYGNLNGQASLAADGRSFELTLDTQDPTQLLNQFVTQPHFTVHLVTCDNHRSALLGRALDTLGPGPDLSSNSLQTVTVFKGLGVTLPIPSSYPDDPLNDFLTREDLPPDYPYTNFDLARLEVLAR